ncbi:MAG TPA: hypothetical protein VHT29_07540 [Solirubrobacteraceae bacterium]|jgi:hypothetical protein|nr:hypothetical protein [Solirubrobacteraceae bacterium]
MNTLTVPARPDVDSSARPIPWRRIAWVIWRQHRFALGGVAALLGAVAAYAWIAGPPLHHAYALAAACHPASSIACEQLSGRFNGMDNFMAHGYAMQAVPALIGTFVGAPVLARELETGTFRFAWTQGFGRSRWTLAKLVGLALVLAAAAGALSVLLSWYYRPYFTTSNGAHSLVEMSPLAGRLFDLRGVAFPAWTLAAFAIGALAGMLIRRVVPAIGAALAAYAGLALVTTLYLRRHYQTQVITTKLTLPGSAWITNQQWLTKDGRAVGESVVSRVLQGAPPALAGKGGVPKALGSWQYLVQHGYTLRRSYQPAGRFWSFQWIEGGWLFALSSLLIAVTILLAQRRGG